jgi:hypothetical protein
MTILPIRKRLGETEEETAHRPTDSPGLLFFHLFEDWFSAFNLISRREHRYAAQLNELVRLLQVKQRCSDKWVLMRNAARVYVSQAGTQAHRQTASHRPPTGGNEALIPKLRVAH